MQGFNPDPYEVLGIARDAAQREVKQTYRSLAMRFHPDHNPGRPEAAECFKQIQRAYEILIGRKKQDWISPAAIYHKNSPASFSQNEHPFFSFHWAMKTHGERIMKNMKSSHSGIKKKQ